jgi:hypothetical protein
VLRLFSSTTLLFTPSFGAILFLFLSTALISLRWRGSFNGGSDFMSLIVLSALTVATAFQDNPKIAVACLWYIAIQTCTSYFIAGIIKLRRKNWRTGKALAGFLSTTIYGSSAVGQAISSRPTVAALFSWGVMLFECAFPIALLNSRLSIAFMVVAFLFHLGNFYFFGLNRFLLSWSATYPALYFISKSR